MIKQILITRPGPDAKVTAQQLDQLGFSCFIEPMQVITFNKNFIADIEKISSLKNPIFIFTSANAIRTMPDLSNFKNNRVLAVGKKTADEIILHGYKNVTITGQTVTDMLDYINNNFIAGADNFIYFSGDIISADIEKILSEKSYNIIRQVVYQTTPITSLSDHLINKISNNEFFAALFYSPANAKIFTENLLKYQLSGNMQKTLAFCISKRTADRLGNIKFRSIHIAQSPTENSLLALIQNFKLS